VGISTKERKQVLLQRRLKVADLLLDRVSQRQIAKELAISESTICRDVRVIMTAWSDELAVKGALIRAREAFELDLAERQAVEHYQNAVLCRQVVEKSDQDGKHSQAWERYDRAARSWLDARLRIKERRAKLLNLDMQTPPSPIASLHVPISFIQVRPPDPRPQLAGGQQGGDGDRNDVIDLDHESFEFGGGGEVT
jgi:hypothetical protein